MEAISVSSYLLVFGIGQNFQGRSPVHLNDRWSMNNQSFAHAVLPVAITIYVES